MWLFGPSAFFGKFTVLGYSGQKIKKKKKTKKQPSKNAPVPIVLPRCLLGLVFLVGEICTVSLRFHFTSLLAGHVSTSTAGSICSLLWWLAQEMSGHTVAMTLNTCFSALFEQNKELFKLCNICLPRLLVNVCIHLVAVTVKPHGAFPGNAGAYGSKQD